MKTKQFLINAIFFSSLICLQTSCYVWCRGLDYSNIRIAYKDGKTQRTFIKASNKRIPPPQVFEIQSYSSCVCVMVTCARISNVKPILYVVDDEGYLINTSVYPSYYSPSHMSVNFCKEPKKRYYLIIVFTRLYKGFHGYGRACVSIYSMYKSSGYYPPPPKRN